MIPDGWVAQGWRFEVETTRPVQRSLIQQHFGARRFAYNWALAQVKANLDARAADPSVPALAWTLPTLRKAWNQSKGEVAPWWPACSKDTYACGITDLVAALYAWSASKQGQRAGSPVRFPRFKARHRDRGRVRFDSGALRLEADRRHLTLPVIGKLRSKENTRRLVAAAHKGAGPGAVDDPQRAKRPPLRVGGHDCRARSRQPTRAAWPLRDRPRHRRRVGGRSPMPTTRIERVTHPAPWIAVQRQRRRVARQASRRIVGSRGHRQAKTKLAALDRRAANLRREAIHILTTRLARRYGTIVVEDLDVAAMTRGMGRRAFRRSVYQAGLGRVRPTLAYKTSWSGGRLVVADRWFASSKTHHGCGGYLADLTLGQRVWRCPACGRAGRPQRQCGVESS